MTGDRKVRVAANVSDAIPTVVALENIVSRFRFPCEVLPLRNKYQALALHCDVLAPTDIPETEIRREFKEFIAKIEKCHQEKEQTRQDRQREKNAQDSIKRGLRQQEAKKRQQ